jgi:hypothetical protein
VAWVDASSSQEAGGCKGRKKSQWEKSKKIIETHRRGPCPQTNSAVGELATAAWRQRAGNGGTREDASERRAREGKAMTARGESVGGDRGRGDLAKKKERHDKEDVVSARAVAVACP